MGAVKMLRFLRNRRNAIPWWVSCIGLSHSSYMTLAFRGFQTEYSTMYNYSRSTICCEIEREFFNDTI